MNKFKEWWANAGKGAKIGFVVVIFLVIGGIGTAFGSNDDTTKEDKTTEKSDKNDDSKETAKEKEKEEEKEEEKKPEIKTYTAGTYKVGTDLPAGEYALIGDGYFAIKSDSSGTLESIISNDNFVNNSIVTVSDGQYLEVSRATIYNLSDATIKTDGEGMFKVGVHIPAGEYKLTSTSSTMGYYAVYADSTHVFESIITNDNFEGDTYITVSDGQYLVINRAKIVE